MAHEAALFFRQLLSNPQQVSAIAPSSRWLARAMAQGLGPNSGRVIEFGPGTGVLTKGILDAGVAPENLTVFEMNADFCTHLRQKFPGVTVHNAPAQSAVNSVEPGVTAVVSGLPLLSMPLPLRESIVIGRTGQILVKARGHSVSERVRHNIISAIVRETKTKRIPDRLTRALIKRAMEGEGDDYQL